jgi:hypothetical protein
MKQSRKLKTHTIAKKKKEDIIRISSKTQSILNFYANMTSSKDENNQVILYQDYAFVIKLTMNDLRIKKNIFF